MLYKPTRVGDLWDPYVLFHGGRFHLFHMVGINRTGHSHRAICLATSADGVHWSEHGVVADGRPDLPVFAGCVWRARDRFMMNHGSARADPKHASDQCIRFWESDDLVSWRYRGDEACVYPDARWYGTRWDCMDPLPRGDGGFYGYITADALPEAGAPTVGMLESEDGVTWRAAPPPVIEWDGIGRQVMEVGGCQKIGDRYYLMLGAYLGYLGNVGYGMYTFVADSPRGPFRPDLSAFRLCGSTHQEVTWLARFCRLPGELLVTNDIAHRCPGPDVWLLPMRKALVDADGHLRLHYWRGNDALKGAAWPIDLARVEPVHAAPAPAACAWQHSAAGLRLQAKRREFSRDGSGPALAVVLAQRFDPDCGAIVEGTLALEDTTADAPFKTHVPSTVAGFLVEDAAGSATAMLLDTLGVTRIGPLSYGTEWAFETRDFTGPGCATLAGFPAGKPQFFRLLVRRNMLELYLAERLVQTFYTADRWTGRVGFLVQNGALALTELRAWSMSLESRTETDDRGA